MNPVDAPPPLAETSLPVPDDRDTTAVETERDVLVSTLNRLRKAAIAKTEGLRDEVGRAVDPVCGYSLYGLISHLTEVERFWSDRVFRGLDVNLAWDNGDNEADFAVALHVSYESLVNSYRAAGASFNDLANNNELETLSNPKQFEHVRSLRWIGWHLVQETARHCGHLDILRQRIDGRTGHK